jgi:hypothetical protein
LATLGLAAEAAGAPPGNCSTAARARAAKADGPQGKYSAAPGPEKIPQQFTTLRGQHPAVDGEAVI